MAHLFKPKIVRYVDSRGRRVEKRASGAPKVRAQARKWYGKYLDEDGREKRVPLCADKVAAHAMLNELMRQVERQHAGLRDPFEEQRKRPLLEHLEDYRRYLLAKGDTGEYAAKTVHRIKDIIEGCGFRSCADIEAARAVEFLASLRGRGLGIKTTNYYLAAVKGFTAWLVRERRVPDNPLIHLGALNPRTDVRVERRALSMEEFQRLIEETGARDGDFRGLTGRDRAMLYTVAAYTGLRASELAALSSSSFDLRSNPPTVTVDAAYSKRRRRDTQPLPDWLTGELRVWIEGRVVSSSCGDAEQSLSRQGRRARRAEKAQRLWPGTWRERAARMIRADLEAAGIPYADAAGRVFDFHALRHQFISNLAQAGVHPRVAQQLARHSTITLTMDRYAHLQTADLAGALGQLPVLGVSGNVGGTGAAKRST